MTKPLKNLNFIRYVSLFPSTLFRRLYRLVWRKQEEYSKCWEVENDETKNVEEGWNRIEWTNTESTITIAKKDKITREGSEKDTYKIDEKSEEPSSSLSTSNKIEEAISEVSYSNPCRPVAQGPFVGHVKILVGQPFVLMGGGRRAKAKILPGQTYSYNKTEIIEIIHHFYQLFMKI